MKAISRDNDFRSIVFYDGICNLCSHTVQFFLKLDRKNNFKFIALQSPPGREMLQNFGYPENSIDSVMLLKDNQPYFKSKAIFQMVKETGGILSILLIFQLFPDKFNDYLYDLVARNRYLIFGKRKKCFIIE
jgi:predicted DCC family thiol-disulfide oxidoreductase YuxK